MNRLISALTLFIFGMFFAFDVGAREIGAMVFDVIVAGMALLLNMMED